MDNADRPLSTRRYREGGEVRDAILGDERRAHDLAAASATRASSRSAA
jgi:hypothetical protein